MARGRVPFDEQSLRDRVVRELKWDPRVDHTKIGVIVADGAVTLTGRVSTYSEKVAAVEAAERVDGVRAVADGLQVVLGSRDVRDDADLAEAIASKLRWNVLVPRTVEAEVRDGFVTLVGQVRWGFQRDAAERAVRDVRGVRGVSNEIAVRPQVRPDDVVGRIVEAIDRAADLDARAIRVTAADGTVRLDGRVHSLHERKVAEQAAKSAPGVQRVDNRIVVAL
ncbi:MAG: BON domain-containing protein [Gaiellaceae bacterium]